MLCNLCVGVRVRAFQEGVRGGLPALRVFGLGERAVLCLLLWLPEGVRGRDPVAVPAL